MPSPGGSASLCPLKPIPEKSSLVGVGPIASARVPANACDEQKCAWFMSQVNPQTGKIVAGYCAIPGAVIAISNLNALLQHLQVAAVRQATAGEAPSPTEN